MFPLKRTFYEVQHKICNTAAYLLCKARVSLSKKMNAENSVETFFCRKNGPVRCKWPCKRRMKARNSLDINWKTDRVGSKFGRLGGSSITIYPSPNRQ